MKILVVEDHDENFKDLCDTLTSTRPDWSLSFYRSKSLSDYVRRINSSIFDLIVFDIVIPRRDDEAAYDLSLDLVQELAGTINERTRAVAITSMDSPDYETLLRFNERMVPVLRRSDSTCYGVVSGLLSELQTASKVDFVLVCALEAEANAFENCDVQLGPWKVGLGASSKRSIAIGGSKGYIYVLPRTGLTSAALVTAKVIEFYLPKLVVMPGICAGVSKDCDFTDVLVSEVSWDYQVGKFTEDGFKAEPYQDSIDVNLLAKIKNICATTHLERRVAEMVQSGSDGKHTSKILFGPIASGSAVIADRSKAKEIEEQQRKIVGIEMEISAVYSACRYSSKPPLFFAAKGVVDFADKEKSDVAHKWASCASAFFVVSVLSELLPL